MKENGKSTQKSIVIPSYLKQAFGLYHSHINGNRKVECKSHYRDIVDFLRLQKEKKSWYKKVKTWEKPGTLLDEKLINYYCINCTDSKYAYKCLSSKCLSMFDKKNANKTSFYAA